MVKRDVPFVPNTPDGMQCVAAAYRMIAQYFDKSFDIPMEEWAQICGYEKDKGTWAYGALVWFNLHGYEVHHYESESIEEFVADPEGALVRSFGEDVGQWCIDHSNLEAEVARAKRLLKRGHILRQCEPKLDDIKLYLDECWLVRVNVNSLRLRARAGFAGHSITLVGYDETGVFAHDPGGIDYEPVAYKHIQWALLDACWADPNTKAKELDAIRLV